MIIIIIITIIIIIIIIVIIYLFISNPTIKTASKSLHCIYYDAYFQLEGAIFILLLK